MRFPEEYVFSIMDSLVTSIIILNSESPLPPPPPPSPLPVGKRVEVRGFSAHEILKES